MCKHLKAGQNTLNTPFEVKGEKIGFYKTNHLNREKNKIFRNQPFQKRKNLDFTKPSIRKEKNLDKP